MMDSELLSVIVPVYNNEKYLEQCVRSILNQTYINLEILLVNDGSTDCSGQLCDEISKKDCRVRVIHKENGGAISARRAGCLEAKGNYVTFVDSDDWIDVEMYQYLMGEILSNKADIVTSGFIFNYGKCLDGLTPGVYKDKALKQYVFCKMIHDMDTFSSGIISSVCNKIFRRQLILDAIEAIKKPIRQWEDVAYLYLACYRAKIIEITDKAFYHYRENQESVTKKYDPEYFFKSCDSFAYIEKYLTENNAGELVSQLKYIKLWSFVHALEVELEKSLLQRNSQVWKEIITSKYAHDIMQSVSIETTKIPEHMKKEVELLMNNQYIKARIVHDIYRMKTVYWKIRDRQ